MRIILILPVITVGLEKAGFDAVQSPSRCTALPTSGIYFSTMWAAIFWKLDNLYASATKNETKCAELADSYKTAPNRKAEIEKKTREKQSIDIEEAIFSWPSMLQADAEKIDEISDANVRQTSKTFDLKHFTEIAGDVVALVKKSGWSIGAAVTDEAALALGDICKTVVLTAGATPAHVTKRKTIRGALPAVFSRLKKEKPAKKNCEGVEKLD